MAEQKRAPFFVGYLKVPKALRAFLLAASAALIAGFALMALAIGGTQDDPGEASFRFGWGAQTVTGLLELTPEPIVHVTKGTKRVLTGRTIMLSAGGKRGVHQRAKRFDGKMVTVSGVVLMRGDLQMLQLRGGRNGLRAAQNASPMPIASKKLGRWKLTGEICDGKCLAGAMRPGRGISHKACANFCLIGGAPPVFVSTALVDGRAFFLLADLNGAPIRPQILDHVARYVEVEGDVEKRGDLHIFRVDLATLRDAGAAS